MSCLFTVLYRLRPAGIVLAGDANLGKAPRAHLTPYLLRPLVKTRCSAWRTTSVAHENNAQILQRPAGDGGLTA